MLFCSIFQAFYCCYARPECLYNVLYQNFEVKMTAQHFSSWHKCTALTKKMNTKQRRCRSNKGWRKREYFPQPPLAKKYITYYFKCQGRYLSLARVFSDRSCFEDKLFLYLLKLFENYGIFYRPPAVCSFLFLTCTSRNCLTLPGWKIPVSAAFSLCTLDDMPSQKSFSLLVTWSISRLAGLCAAIRSLS